jgi:hypothetical protein
VVQRPQCCSSFSSFPLSSVLTSPPQTASSILSAAPYNFSSSGVGLIYLGPLVGVFFAAAYSGWFGDKYSLWQAKKSHGIREPEDRLWLMAITMLFVPASLILWGVGAGAGISYGGLAVGAGMSSFCSAVTGSLTIGYLLDSYKDLGGEMLISIILVRVRPFSFAPFHSSLTICLLQNTLSFAIVSFRFLPPSISPRSPHTSLIDPSFSSSFFPRSSLTQRSDMLFSPQGYGITPWLNLGLRNTFISAAFVGLAISSSFLIMIRWGKHFRASSREKYWAFVASGEGY